ncbi:RnfABCDGE type electron transport complex subunit D [Marinospirillum sp.]|uniref:RnfABCDGE type electron transport complex subunit D n=1 Tax=Marinospirillum sp. TaxID=2183934 RepID=UPI00286FCA6A|nr:RnfABCDGE type electron transport complex subunit D [Marinospirillum sp.]MDR9467938.1 RnfABCDGE type electron transport complex subunit D [Marinospirillum sp.]
MSLPVHGPHAHSSNQLAAMMLQVMLALTPATLYAFWLYGWPAFNVWVLSLVSALFWEALFLKFFAKPVTSHLKDGSALVTAWILALCLPPWAPWWLVIVGTFLAVAMIKQIFGGLGQNVFNPAMAARVMLLIAFPVEMTTWINPEAVTHQAPDFMTGLGVTLDSVTVSDAFTGATLLDEIKNQTAQGKLLSDTLIHQDYQISATLSGHQIGSLGETSALLLLLGGVYLLWKGIITWQAPVGLLLGMALPAFLLHLFQPEAYPGAGFHLLTGGAFLAAFFIVTDPVTAPTTATGRLAFGLGCGLLAWLIRSFGNYPEGLAFAVMLMNAAVPVIDRYFKPRIYGRTSKGDPLPKNRGDAS